MSVDENASEEARPGLAPSEPAPVSTEVLEVDGERFLLSEYLPSGDRHGYGYEWLTGPNQGYGFGSFGPKLSLPEHEVSIHQFLADIDPETGYLSEQADLPVK